MKFSGRRTAELSNNPLSRVLERIGTGQLLDLTESNPTRCGFEYPSDLLKALSHPEGLTYEPAPFGLSKARQAVVDYLITKGIETSSPNVILTASTSEAYSYLFKLLGNPGDSV